MTRPLALAAGVLGLPLAAWVALVLADVSIDRSRFVHPEDAVTVLDRTGRALRHQRSDGLDRRWVPLEEIDPRLVDALVAVEDRRFFEHPGVDGWAVARAVLTSWWPGRRPSGASTLTQQLLKQVYGRPNGLWLDKPRELLRALRLEARFDKRWILEQLLNRLPFGNGIVGVGRASEVYLGHSVSRLTLAEAALLAGIPQAPSALEPRRHPEGARRRRDFVLSRMVATGRARAEDAARAREAPLRLADRAFRPWRAPRFADAALRAWREGDLAAEGGALRTSLDLALQEEVEAILSAAVARHAGRGVSNGAAVVLDVSSGEVLAYVGAARRGSAHPGGWLDLLRAPRQPGSTLKPFVYGLLLERGASPATLLEDLPRPMVDGRGAVFEAENYDGRARGPVTLRQALAASLNLAALDAARRVGAEPIAARFARLGLLPDATPVGAAVVLGGVDVAPLTLARAYLALARGGRPVALRPSPGAPREREAFGDASSVALLTDVLRDGGARERAFGAHLEDLVGFPFALKTGTSHGFRDAWTAVYSEAFVAVVWLGDPRGRPLDRLGGFEAAARPAARILGAAHRLRPDAAAAPEVPLVAAEVCATSGALPGPGCHHRRVERFRPGHLPRASCALHGADGRLHLPPRYADWARTERPDAVVASPGSGAGTLRIRHPEDGARFLLDPARPAPRIPLRATLDGVEAAARWELDGAPLPGGALPLTEGRHELVARVGDLRERVAFAVVR
jgi:penicillin-binding protein 1C